MFLLLFFVLLIQFLTYWIFEPLASFLEYFLEIRIFPTDTLPAIACLPEFSNIIYEFKKRDRDKPLILMGSEHKQLVDYVHE